MKAYDGESIYRVLECTPHNNDEIHLEEIFNNKSEFKFYEKSEADAVINAVEQRIKLLEGIKHADMVRIAELERLYKNELDKATELGNDLISANGRIKELESKNAELKKKSTDLEVQYENFQSAMYEAITGSLAIVIKNRLTACLQQK